MQTREKTNVYLCDFDGTLTGSDGQQTINTLLYKQLTTEGRFGSPFKSESEMLKILEQEFKIQKERSPQRLTESAIDFLMNVTDKDAKSADIVIISRNFEAYVRVMIKYELMQKGISDQEIEVCLNKIKVMDRVSLGSGVPLEKGVAAKKFLEGYRGEDISIHALDDDIKDGRAMEAAAKTVTTDVSYHHINKDFKWMNVYVPAVKNSTQISTTHKQIINAITNQSSNIDKEKQRNAYFQGAFGEMVNKVPDVILKNFIWYLSSQQLGDKKSHETLLYSYLNHDMINEASLNELNLRVQYILGDLRSNIDNIRDVIKSTDAAPLSATDHKIERINTTDKLRIAQEVIYKYANTLKTDKKNLITFLESIRNDEALKLDEITTKHPGKQEAKGRLRDYLDKVAPMISTDQLNPQQMMQVKSTITTMLKTLAEVSQVEQRFGTSKTAKAVNNILKEMDKNSKNFYGAKRNSIVSISSQSGLYRHQKSEPKQEKEEPSNKHHVSQKR